MIFPTRLEMSATPSSLAAAPQSAGTNASGLSRSASGEPQVDMGPSLAVTSPTPGRFANAIQKITNARHALQVIREDATSSFVLNLDPDGSATICRGWRYVSFNDGPEVHTSEYIREQLGYRGHWEHRGEWVYLHITLDESVCPRVGEYGKLVPNHSREWHLHCLPIEPREHPALTMPVLACRPANVEPVFGEDEPHRVAGILPGQWILLGAGNGLRIRVTAGSLRGDEAPVVRVEYATNPVGTNAWEHSF